MGDSKSHKMKVSQQWQVPKKDVEDSIFKGVWKDISYLTVCNIIIPMHLVLW